MGTGRSYAYGSTKVKKRARSDRGHVEIAGGDHWKQKSVDVVCFPENEAARCETQLNPPRDDADIPCNGSGTGMHSPCLLLLAPLATEGTAKEMLREAARKTIATWRQSTVHTAGTGRLASLSCWLLDPYMVLPGEWTCVRADGWFCTMVGVAVLLLVALTTPQQSTPLPSGRASEVGSPRPMELRGGFPKGFPQDISPRKLFPKETYGEGELEMGNSFEQVWSHITS